MTEHFGVGYIGQFICNSPHCPSVWHLMQKIINFSDSEKAALSDS